METLRSTTLNRRFAYCTSLDDSIDLVTSGKQTVSDSGLRQLLFFHLRVMMSTSRKLAEKLDTHLRCSPKHRRAARKATLTEAAQDDPVPIARPPANKLSLPLPRSRPWPRGELSPPALRSQVLNLFLSLAVREEIICRTHFVHLYISEPTPSP